ncbi:type IV pilus twitching motility protein PilT [Microbacterium sp. A588]
MANENEFASDLGGSRFDALLGGSEVDSELRSFLNGVPGVTLPAMTPPVQPMQVQPAPVQPLQRTQPQPVQQQPVQQQPVYSQPVQPQPVQQRAFDPAPMYADDAPIRRRSQPAPAPAAAPAAPAAFIPQDLTVALPTMPPMQQPQRAPEPAAVTQILDTSMSDFSTPSAFAAPAHFPTAHDASLPDFTEQTMSKPPIASRFDEIEAVLIGQNPEVDPEFVASVAAVLDLGASDLHLVAESTPVVRIDGQLKSVAETSIWDRDRIARVIDGFVPAEQMRVFEKELELDLAYSVGDIARFRVNIFQDQRGLGAALRIIPTEIKSVTKLGLPRELVELANLPRGLVLVCGPTGSGKSTTLAAIIDKANSSRASHIITVEDPIEFMHNHKRGIINQREVGADTHSFSDALKHALRQDPDIILVGEMRDLETISTALTAAETGHLVFATLHTQDAGQTIDRIIDVYPAHQQAQVRTQLAATLRAVIVQTLIPRASGKGRAVATEVMFVNPAIQALIRAGKTHQLRTALQAGTDIGMHTLDQDLARLVLAGDIEYGVAVEIAQDVAEFEQLVRNRGISRAATVDMTPEGTRQSVGGRSGAN